MGTTSAERFGVTLRRRSVQVRLGDAQILALAVIAFIAMTVWWLTQDTRVQDWDNGLHTLAAFNIHDEIASGNLTGWFTEFTTWPPLVHLVGALGVLLAGKSPTSVIITSNVIFVPLLAFSCYGIGRLVSGPRAGLLAGLFALGTPLFVSQMHVFMIDPPQAAMIAAAVWAILAADHFQRLGISALAGLAVGLAMMTKSTSLIFLAGPVAVVLVRGGWRHWRGFAVFLLVAAAISLPWYVYHAHQLSQLAAGQSGTGASRTAAGAPPLFSRASLLWNFWAAANIQLFLPLMLFLIVGVVIAIRQSITERRPDDFRVELLVGLAVSWLGITLIRNKDVRFMLPALVYAAVLGTAWIPAMRPRVRALATGLLVLVLAANFLGISTGSGPTLGFSLPGAPASSLWKRHITIYSPAGYTRGGPEHDGDVLALMRALKRAGVRSVLFDPGSADVNDFTPSGLTVRAIQAGFPQSTTYDPAALGPHDAFVVRRFRQPGDPPPCQKLLDGSGVYVELGNPVKPFEDYTFICPGRHPEIYARTAPLSIAQQMALHPQITGAARSMLLGVLTALHTRGIQTILIDQASANKPFFQPNGVALLAETRDLPVDWSLHPDQLAPNDAYLIRRPIRPSGPKPCGRFPDGTGLFVILGNAVKAHPDYACPLP